MSLCVDAAPDEIVLKKDGYVVEGEACVVFWMGGRGTVRMSSYRIDELSLKEVVAGLNDGGFGVERIEGADCRVSAIYGGSYFRTVCYLRIRDGVCEECWGAGTGACVEE